MTSRPPKRNKPKTVVLDLDDTCVRFLPFLCYIHNAINNTDVTPSKIRTWNLADTETEFDIYGQLKGTTLEDTFRLYEGEGLYALCDWYYESKQAVRIINELGFKLIFLTARNSKFKLQTEMNLLVNSIKYDELIFSENKAEAITKICEKNDVIVFADDSAAHVKAVNSNCRKVKNVVLVSRPHNKGKKISKKISRVADLLEIIKLLRA